VITTAESSPIRIHSGLGGTRRQVSRHAYRLPDVRELPLQLEPVTADGFGGLVPRSRASCALSTTQLRGALS